MVEAPVTRPEFERLLQILHDAVACVPYHVHGLSNGSSYGGSTYGPQERDESAALQTRILALLNGQPEPEEPDHA